MGDDVLGLFQHLALGDPQGGFGHGGGEVVDLDAVELVDGDLNWICIIAHCNLVCLAAERIVFQPTQGDIALGEEVAGAAGGV